MRKVCEGMKWFVCDDVELCEDFDWRLKREITFTCKERGYSQREGVCLIGNEGTFKTHLSHNLIFDPLDYANIQVNFVFFLCLI